jgi:hypothetical protein
MLNVLQRTRARQGSAAQTSDVDIEQQIDLNADLRECIRRRLKRGI